LLQETLDSVATACPYPADGIALGRWRDKGYGSAAVYGTVRQNGYVPHSVPRDAEREWQEKIPGYIPRRWPVERTISWQNRFRRILGRWEKQVANSLAMVPLACACVAFKRAGLA